MIKVTSKSIAISVVFGLLITFGYLGNMEYIQYDSETGSDYCTYSYGIKEPVQTPLCSGLSYGYPQKYISSWPTLEYTEKNGNVDTTTLMVSSKVNFDIAAFVTNLVIWSGVSFAVLTAVHILLPKNKKTSMRKK
ncbi:MAG TPA: hypothetical protein PKB09_00095 [Candidatus Saccharibacteria bacterium]|nr:hypothetical protein [Candidatus Saccharibacteria bacterium]